jgi:hypothetical protein
MLADTVYEVGIYMNKEEIYKEKMQMRVIILSTITLQELHEFTELPIKSIEDAVLNKELPIMKNTKDKVRLCSAARWLDSQESKDGSTQFTANLMSRFLP